MKSLVICSFHTADEVITSIDPQKVEILQRYMLETCIEMYMIIDSQDFIMLLILLLSHLHCFDALMIMIYTLFLTFCFFVYPDILLMVGISNG
jgi:hypothetical protein